MQYSAILGSPFPKYWYLLSLVLVGWEQFWIYCFAHLIFIVSIGYSLNLGDCSPSCDSIYKFIYSPSKLLVGTDLKFLHCTLNFHIYILITTETIPLVLISYINLFTTPRNCWVGTDSNLLLCTFNFYSFNRIFSWLGSLFPKYRFHI